MPEPYLMLGVFVLLPVDTVGNVVYKPLNAVPPLNVGDVYTV